MFNTSLLMNLRSRLHFPYRREFRLDHLPRVPWSKLLFLRRPQQLCRRHQQLWRRLQLSRRLRDLDLAFEGECGTVKVVT